MPPPMVVVVNCEYKGGLSLVGYLARLPLKRRVVNWFHAAFVQLFTTGCSVSVTRAVRDGETLGSIPSTPTRHEKTLFDEVFEWLV